MGQPTRQTGSGGDILEGHDFLTIDMERPLQNEASDYGRFAEKVIRRRLEAAGIEKSPKDFFPVHPRLAAGLKRAAESVRSKAREEMPDAGRSGLATTCIDKPGRVYPNAKPARQSSIVLWL